MIFGTIAAAVALAGCVSGPKVDNTPVATLDLNRYLGEWYEIARFDTASSEAMIRTSSFGCGKTNASDVADKVLAAHFPFKISNLRLTMSRRFGIIEPF
jgi:lipocalin